MSELSDTLRQLGKEYGQAGGYIHLELAVKADALERERDDYMDVAQRATARGGQLELELLALRRDVENLVKERNLYLAKLNEIRRLADMDDDIDRTREISAIVGYMAGFNA